MTFDPVLNLADLDGSNGFRLDGAAEEDSSGVSVSDAGDINGDGLEDLIIGASRADFNGNRSGSSYVVFGSNADFSSTLNLADLDGSNGFRLNGAAEDDYAGGSVSGAGDINGDSIDDLIVGAVFADPNGTSSGSSYVVFGTTSGFSPTLNLADLDGSNGFRLNGESWGDFLGGSMSSAGDINDDGIDDLIIGAVGANPNGRGSGSSYVVFGTTSGFSPTLNLADLDGSNGFRLDGTAVLECSGESVSDAGDINGDGIDDLIIGAYKADINGNRSGSSYVVFGSNAGFSPILTLSSLDGSNGFRVDGAAENDLLGGSVSSAGDINGDGLDDLIIGASGADPNGSFSGSSYVVFGTTSGFSPIINISDLDGSNGFRLDGEAKKDVSGRSVSSAGDINGDGLDDLIISAPGADPNGSLSGSSYVVFGRASGFSATFNLADLNGRNGFRLDGVAGDSSGRSVSGAGDINGDGFDDLIIGAELADPNGRISGSSYVVFGRATPTQEADDLEGTAAANVIRALGGNDTVRGLAGGDRLFGQAGDDLLIGGTGNDRLIGGADNDSLLGGGGNDRLDGRVGNDVITTGAGRDVIVVRREQGFDQVTDFQNNRDTIDLVGLRFGQLTIRQRQDDVLIKLGDTNLLRLEDTNVAVINRADFV